MNALDDGVHVCFGSTFKNLVHSFERSLGGRVEPQPHFRGCVKQVIELLNGYLALAVGNLSLGRTSSVVALLDDRHSRTKHDDWGSVSIRPSKATAIRAIFTEPGWRMRTRTRWWNT